MHVERVHITKANVCGYLGREIPNHVALGLDADKVYRLYRHPDELRRAAHTFNNLPLLADHIVVSADNPEQQAVVGTTGSDVEFNHPYLDCSLALWVDEAIDGVESQTKRELSSAYGYRADMTPGVTPDGVAYHGVMRDIVGNHVATVREGRVGPDVLVTDEMPPELLELALMSLKRTTVALAIKSFLLPTVDTVALDAALDKSMSEGEDKAAKDAKKEAMDAAAADAAHDANMLKECQDASPEDWEEDPEKPGKKRMTKAAKDKAKTAKDAKIAAALATSGGAKDSVTKDEAQKMATDAATAASKAAVDANNALHAARADVVDVVGVVALDSAEAVYRFALEQEKVADAKTIHASALPTVWGTVKAGKKARTLAHDGASAAISGDAQAAISAIGI